ncbi:MAG: Holliday junction branch migration DNA helicase RuvB [Deltaproteobacteria bacterium]|nr:Holliday junction branch migration DNA helicase RuvB [Deltaproteobacteria bacterium]MBW2200044.1 Holliday junction branch migration DNA helicase RuvB [Deltaproteobacteria bacterium]MBW2538242.1 Holliday junction branch migration DNA helicase RuvB [Deltaproteobacteria bacterium]
MTDDKQSPSNDVQGLLSRSCVPVDENPEILSLRPEQLSDYIGQAEVVETLRIAIEAAMEREEPIDHVIFHGPPGLGKTTLAHIIANEMGSDLTITSGPALEKGGDLVGILTHLEQGDVLFIDEIHRMPKIVEEFLYPAMEDFAIDFIFDKGVHARSHRYRLKGFTLVGATTRMGLLSAPLRDRFGIFRNLDFYSEKDLVKIARRSAALLKVAIDDEGAIELAKRSRGTPRIVNRLLKRVRDYTQVRSDGVITKDAVNAALSLEGVDEKGLTNLDRRYLRTIIEFYHGGPAGIEAIAATLQEETDTLADVVEPYLLKIGLITRTSSGRKASEAAYQHLGFRVQKKIFS